MGHTCKLSDYQTGEAFNQMANNYRYISRHSTIHIDHYEEEDNDAYFVVGVEDAEDEDDDDANYDVDDDMVLAGALPPALA